MGCKVTLFPPDWWRDLRRTSVNASRAEWHEEVLKERLCWRLAEVGPEKIRLGLYCPPTPQPQLNLQKSQLGCSTEILSQLRESQSFVNSFKICCLQEKGAIVFSWLIGFGRRIQKVKPITCYHVISQQQANFFSHMSAFNMVRLYWTSGTKFVDQQNLVSLALIRIILWFWVNSFIIRLESDFLWCCLYTFASF